MPNKVLGLSVGERGVLACELARSGRATQVTRLAEFDYPAGTSPDNGAEVGKALADFLRSRRFSAKRTVIGLPLRWAVVKPKEVPPVDPSAVSSMLLLQAEREFALEPQDLVYEYAGESDPSAARTLLLLAVHRKRVDAVVAMAEAAGLNVEGVTLSAVALAAETGRQLAHGGAVLHVAPGTAELAIHHGGQPRALRHLRAPAAAGAGAAGSVPLATAAESGEIPAAPEAPAEPPRFSDAATALTPELRQVLSLMPQNGTAAPTELVVWDGIGLGDAPSRWGDLLHVAVRAQSLDSLGVTVSADAGDGTAPPGGGRYAAAVALALEGLRGGGVVTDLLHSRLVPKKERRVGRWTVWAVVLGVTFVSAIVFAVFDLSSQRREVEETKARLKSLQPQLQEAKAAIDRTTFAQRWTNKDPKALSLLRDVTVAFPEGGRVWATSLILQADGRVTLGCRATSDDAPGALLKRLRDGKKFTEVQLGNTQPGGKGSGEVSFTITFRYPGI
jgi:Tfp pilus assembly protein PilN